MTEPLADQVVSLYLHRKNAQQPEFEQMREIRQMIYGEFDLPVTEMMENEKPAAPNLGKLAMQQLARRTVSVMPSVTFPALSESDQARADANKRVRIMKSWYETTKIKSTQAQRARWFYVYAKAPVVVLPNKQTHTPHWKPITPLNLYPAPCELGEMVPSDVIYETTRTLGWLQEHFPNAAARIKQPVQDSYSKDLNQDTEYTLLRYISSTLDLLVLKANEETHPSSWGDAGTSNAEMLLEGENLAGMPLCVIPQAISLDFAQGQFDDIPGMYEAQSRLIALQMIAQKRAVFPREWMEANPGEEPVVRAVPKPNEGKPGRIKGGRIVQQNIDPSMRTLELADRLEYAARMTAGIPAEFGGQGSTNVRTARRGGQVIGQTVDFTIAEAQDLFAESLYYENLIAIAIDKAYYPKQKNYFIMSPSYNGEVKYTPSELWKEPGHLVRYPMSGTDAETLVLTTSQRVATGVMSQDTAMDIDPLIEDKENEKKKIELETVKRGMMASLEAQAQNPEGPYSPLGFADLYKKMMVEGMDLEDALIKQQEEAQARQQAMAEQASASTNPGMALPGEPAPGVESAAIPEVQPSQQHLSSLLSSLYSTQAATKSRAPITQPA